MTLDATARPLALKLINKYGASVTYTQVTAGAYNPATSSATPTTVASTVKAVVETFAGTHFFSELIIAGDKKFTCPASSFSSEPKPGDTVTLDSIVYTVVAVKAIFSGALAAIYEIAARK